MAIKVKMSDVRCIVIVKTAVGCQRGDYELVSKGKPFYLFL